MNDNSRLSEERKKVWRSQADAAAACGVSREMWGKYERGDAAPGGEVLARMATAGLDVLYILTGQRAGNAPAPPSLSPEHRALIDNYDACSPLDQKAVRSLASTAAQFHQLTGGKKKAKGGKK